MSAPPSPRLRGSGRERMLVTPEGIALPITLASKGARAGALLMDLVFVALLQIATTVALASI
ncbi:MAG: RDD family protein, partial [Alphaproteobacteria bacterium]|nr:RDD family protein [Alphaproteobacteria bacterium]